MLYENSTKYLNSFGFHFLNSPKNSPYQLKSIGWEIRTSRSYSWDGMKRKDDNEHCIFQYTLSGSGEIRISDKVYALKKGDAFLIKIPDNHHYYLPESSDKWEFIYIHLYGQGSIVQCTDLLSSYGNVFKLSSDSPVITYLWKVYWDAVNNNIEDGYQTSSFAYNFIMELHRSKVVLENNISSKYSLSIESVINFIEHNFSTELTLDDLAKIANMSKFHFNRTFNAVVGTTPWNYLTKIRLEKSVELLLKDNISIDCIAKKVGFSGENYFSKVFRKYLGISPGRFREEHFEINNYSLKL
ncbi:AraC family transcriptional regulator [Clostridium fungisolvens]|uniref:HTH-type transcriptional activator RhaR n=1 Tax=Clostridium fungisolvens TaxID=1604897 RepID=A0A6V8SDF6_9CLOT|nr:AraC family transcriptional regulator [Clostridium fungisolvens]GFP74726.1 HTH-type transcriptional activator RhaR [Clostridium fungisolvens]